MLILISPAKSFAKWHNEGDVLCSNPWFAETTELIAQAALRLTTEEVGRAFRLSPKMAQKAYMQWRNFADPTTETMRALSFYDGVVFKQLGTKRLQEADWAWLQDHLLICSFTYGLLRPCDAIKPYRMEGDFASDHLPTSNIFALWRDQLTDTLIEETKRQGGELCFLASEEMRQLFHWERVEQAVRVITPRFLVPQAGGEPRQIVVYTKQARGAMLREALVARSERIEELRSFAPQGYIYREDYSDENDWIYLLSEE